MDVDTSDSVGYQSSCVSIREMITEVMTGLNAGNRPLHMWTLIFVVLAKGHVNNIPKMQFVTGISRNAPSQSYMLSLTECVWDFQNNSLWDTYLHALLVRISLTVCKSAEKGHTSTV